MKIWDSDRDEDMGEKERKSRSDHWVERGKRKGRIISKRDPSLFPSLLYHYFPHSLSLSLSMSIYNHFFSWNISKKEMAFHLSPVSCLVTNSWVTWVRTINSHPSIPLSFPLSFLLYFSLFLSGRLSPCPYFHITSSSWFVCHEKMKRLEIRHINSHLSLFSPSLCFFSLSLLFRNKCASDTAFLDQDQSKSD